MYECNPNVRQDLELIQNQIFERIQHLRETDIPLSDDWTLKSYYELNSEIQSCILNDHTFSPVTLGIIVGIGIGICLTYYFRIWKRKKKNMREY
jgi:hypothetical protein